MPKYIDAIAFLEHEIHESGFQPDMADKRGNYRLLKDELEQFPAADVLPIIHAHVVTNWLGDCRCSNCGDYCDCTKKFCAECGARFDEPQVMED